MTSTSSGDIATVGRFFLDASGGQGSYENRAVGFFARAAFWSRRCAIAASFAGAGDAS